MNPYDPKCSFCGARRVELRAYPFMKPDEAVCASCYGSAHVTWPKFSELRLMAHAKSEA